MPLPLDSPKTSPGAAEETASGGVRRFVLLPHELFFGVFLLITWMRLSLVEGLLGPDALLYLVLIAFNIAAIWFARSRETQASWRASLLFYPIAMNVLFTNMKTSIPKIHPAKMDALLQAVDGRLIGANLSLGLEPLVHPLLTELFSFCYFLFFLYLLFSLVYYFLGDIEVLRKFVTGLFTIYGIGFIGYSLIPAAGPCHAMAAQFTVPLNGWWITQLNAAIVARGSNGVDVFPSLHCAVSAFFLFFDRRHRPWRFKLYLVPCVGLWLSTIYLRYHYFIDVVCGFGLAALALWLTNRARPLPIETVRFKTTDEHSAAEPQPKPKGPTDSGRPQISLFKRHRRFCDRTKNLRGPRKLLCIVVRSGRATNPKPESRNPKEGRNPKSEKPQCSLLLEQTFMQRLP